MNETDIQTLQEQRHNTVVKSNKIIQNSRFSLSAQQQKVILYIVSKIKPTDTTLNEQEFSIVEFCDICGISKKGDIYRLLRNQIKDISDKSIWVEITKGKYKLLRWIETPQIDINSGTIKIKLNDDMTPYLLQLKEQFTIYELINILNFKCKYSIRLYEYLKSIQYDKTTPYTTTLDIDTFQKAVDSSYKDFKDFNSRVLKPAEQEINLFSDIFFEYSFIYKGRKVTHIEITVRLKDIKNRLQANARAENNLNKGNN